MPASIDKKHRRHQIAYVLPLPVWPYTMMVTLKPDSAASMSCVMPHMRMTSTCRGGRAARMSILGSCSKCFRSRPATMHLKWGGLD